MSITTMSHTPGPWVYDIRKAELTAPEVTMLGIKTGAAIWGPSYGPSPADGQLCAAAPDMLAALKALLGEHGCGLGMLFSERVALAKAAIAKAETSLS
jgi:hypothetical protein